MTRPNFCGNCGYKFEPSDTHCPKCVRPAQSNAYGTRTLPQRPPAQYPGTVQTTTPTPGPPHASSSSHAPNAPHTPGSPHASSTPYAPGPHSTPGNTSAPGNPYAPGAAPVPGAPYSPGAASVPAAQNNTKILGGAVLVGFCALLFFIVSNAGKSTAPTPAPAAPSPPVATAPAQPAQAQPAQTQPAQPIAAPAPTPTPAPTPVPIRVGPSFFEVDARMDDRRTELTEAQVQTYWKSVSGTLVTWEGEVTEVRISSGGEIDLKCNPKTFTSDVSVSLDGSQIDKLASINKSQRITIQGILQSHGLTGYRISQGRVVGL